jgi:hypothetical protein
MPASSEAAKIVFVFMVAFLGWVFTVAFPRGR